MDLFQKGAQLHKPKLPCEWRKVSPLHISWWYLPNIKPYETLISGSTSREAPGQETGLLEARIMRRARVTGVGWFWWPELSDPSDPKFQRSIPKKFWRGKVFEHVKKDVGDHPVRLLWFSSMAFEMGPGVLITRLNPQVLDYSDYIPISGWFCPIPSMDSCRTNDVLWHCKWSL